MKTIHVKQLVKIPSGISVKLKGRTIIVKGKRGTLRRNFSHLSLEMKKEGKRTIKVEVWFADRKQQALVNTVCSHIQNLFKGVTYGFRYKMRGVYAHFPINIIIEDNAADVEIRNFIGEKAVRHVKMLEGVSCVASAVKDEIYVEGNDLDDVSRCAARIHQSVLVHGKDIRKFLDGIYVSEKTTIESMEN
ncbi:60S ribosomal protein L9 [Oopsacas minuta]|uniref:Large ribosomal subunit protein uL6 n=1 Tax=Oopsacas minuta TaxID=111878 RepID=A0AAV7K336_9METZ|nr:60S ribosomal protein L9 [Oopsacas minuta]